MVVNLKLNKSYNKITGEPVYTNYENKLVSKLFFKKDTLIQIASGSQKSDIR